MALNLAFEYHGEQHFDPDNFFNSFGPDQFLMRQQRDVRKLHLCESFGVRLLVVPSFIRNKRKCVLLSLLRWLRISELNRTALQSGVGVSQPFDVVSSSASGSGR